MTTDLDKVYSTFDIGLAAYLLCVGCELLELDTTNIRKVAFIFNQTDKLDVEVKSFWDSKGQVVAQVYFNNIKRLKNQIYSSHI